MKQLRALLCFVLLSGYLPVTAKTDTIIHGIRWTIVEEPMPNYSRISLYVKNECESDVKLDLRPQQRTSYPRMVILEGGQQKKLGTTLSIRHRDSSFAGWNYGLITDGRRAYSIVLVPMSNNRMTVRLRGVYRNGRSWLKTWIVVVGNKEPDGSTPGVAMRVPIRIYR